MEVHHHAHTARKKWTHYFWEFLMLFLAVFCGFLAENKREHYVEHQREKQYMQSMLDDLKLDTTEINIQLEQIDSVLVPLQKKSIDLLYSQDFSDSAIREMYDVVPKSSKYFDINFETRTIDQLKNSGNLRLIRNKNVTDSLASYWKICNGFTNILLPGYEETRRSVKEINFSLFNSNYYEGKSPYSLLIKNIPLKLMSTDKTEFIKLGNYIANLQSQLSGAIKRRLITSNTKAAYLINLIKEEYHLK